MKFNLQIRVSIEIQERASVNRIKKDNKYLIFFRLSLTVIQSRDKQGVCVFYDGRLCTEII